MAGEGTKRIIDLTEAAETQSGDYIAIDSTGRGTRKLSAGFMATAEDLSEEETARQTADATLDGKITAEAQARLDADNALGDQITALDEKTEADAALIQNPTKTLSGALCSFTDGADMPTVACTAEIVPKQAGTGTPSPDNVRQISGWESVNLYKSGKNLLNVGGRVNQITAELTYTSDDDYIIINGTKNGSGYATMNNLTLTLPAGTYYAKAFVVSGTTTNNINLYVNNGTSDISGQILNSERSFTLESETTLRFRFAVWQDGTVLTNYTIGIVVSKTSGIDKFYPYIALNATTTDLGRTVYGGTLDVVSGVLTDKMVTYGIGNWSWTLTGGVFRASLPVSAHGSGSNNVKLDNFICSYYPTEYWNASTDKSIRISGDGTLCSVKDTTYTSVADFKTAMSGVQLVYELAEPQTYTLTPTEVSTLLGENNVWADSGDVEITYRRDISIVINNLESALNG